jgi:L-ascorbate metabolism protein UlaG (beta-lactamase superfamily)
MDPEIFVKKSIVKTGNAGVGISLENILLLIDPFINSTNVESITGYVSENSRKDDGTQKKKWAFFTHGHYDHGFRLDELNYLYEGGFSLGIAKEVKEEHERIMKNPRNRNSEYSQELFDLLEKYEVEERIRWLSAGDEVSIKGVGIRAFQAKHQKVKKWKYVNLSDILPFLQKSKRRFRLYNEHKRHPEGNTLGYLIKIGEGRIVHLGSCGIDKYALEGIKDVDRLFLPLSDGPPKLWSKPKYKNEREIIRIINAKTVTPLHDDNPDELMIKKDPKHFADVIKSLIKTKIMPPLYETKGYGS